MEINKEILTLSDIVDICNSDVSNWIESDTSFPKPLKKHLRDQFGKLKILLTIYIKKRIRILLYLKLI